MSENTTPPPGVQPAAMLEPGTTCADCAHLRRCTAQGFTKPENTYCDFIPIRFRAAAGNGRRRRQVREQRRGRGLGKTPHERGSTDPATLVELDTDTNPACAGGASGSRQRPSRTASRDAGIESADTEERNDDGHEDNPGRHRQHVRRVACSHARRAAIPAIPRRHRRRRPAARECHGLGRLGAREPDSPGRLGPREPHALARPAAWPGHATRPAA